MSQMLQRMICLLCLLPSCCWIAEAQNCPASTMTSERAQSGANWTLSKIVDQMQHPANDLILATAHRGAWRYCPENTIEAFHKAMDDGAEAVEMDIRLAVDGTPMMTHDWDRRGEAPHTGVGMSYNNFVYALQPSELMSAPMVNRVGADAVDTENHPIHMHSLNELLDSYLARVQMLTGEDAYSKTVNRGSMVVLDLKGSGDGAESYIEGYGYNTSQYSNLLNSLRAVKAWQDKTGYDLMTHALAFKINLKSIPDIEQFISDYSAIGLQSTPPHLIFIVFPEDMQYVDNDEAKGFMYPERVQKLDTYVVEYSNYLLTDYQYRYPGVSVEKYVLETRQNGRGAGGFASTNAFPEGNRDSDGTCSLSSGLFVRIPCGPQALQKFATSALEFMAPPRVNGVQVIQRASSITTDWYENLVNYLSVIGMRNTEHIR